ncbi:LysE family translocator [uncultured Roseibium sp.]|uniref:LysE family translocator n=1 Tax=uncultured Roseibium sp. TaxID=1936171 RepID=UPI0026119726|nr:LysE family translocator [uncultured Roseibium sp.]
MDTFFLLLLVAGLQIAAAASPGPNFILVSSFSTRESLRSALIATGGITLGIAIWSSLAVLGLGTLITSSPTMFHIVQYLGAFYLAWLGANMLISSFRNTKPDAESENVSGTSSPFLKGFLVNIGNPKTIAYYTSLFAVLIPPDAPLWLLAVVVFVDTFACGAWWVFVALLFGTAPVKRAFSKSRKLIDKLFGSVLIALGLKLALDKH